MFKSSLAKYGFVVLLALISTGIIWLVVSELVPSLKIIFPAFIVPLLLGVLLGILLPIISSNQTKKADKDKE